MLNASQNVGVISVPTNQNKTVQPLTQIPNIMMEQMDKRRVEWEKEVENMAENFFQVKLAKPDSEAVHQTSRGHSLLSLPSNANTDSNNGTKTATTTTTTTSFNTGVKNDDVSRYHDDHTEPEYYCDDDKVTWCRLRFDVRGYEPGDINVRVEGNRKLIVSARSIQPTVTDEGTSRDAVTRQMSKALDLPSGMRPDRITSFLSPNGFLTVMGPIESKNNLLANGSSFTNTEPRECEFRPIQKKPDDAGVNSLAKTDQRDFAAIVPSDCYDVTNRNVVRTEDGDLLLKIVADFGRSDYEPDEITVHFSPCNVRVTARHEQLTSPSSTGIHDYSDGVMVAPVQMSRYEFERDFELPLAGPGRGGINRSTASVMLDPDGRLWIGASLKANTDPLSHRRVTGHVLQMMPRFGRHCRRIEVTE